MKRNFFTISALLILLVGPAAAFSQAPVNLVQKTAPTLQAVPVTDNKVTVSQTEVRQQASPSLEAPAPVNPVAVPPATTEERKQTAPALPVKDE